MSFSQSQAHYEKPQFSQAPDYEPYRYQYQQPQPQPRQPGLMDMLATSLGSGLGEGVAAGIRQQTRRGALERALGGLSTMTPEQKTRLYAESDQDTRDALKYHENLQAQQFKQKELERKGQLPQQSRITVDSERLFNQIAKTHLPEDEDLERRNAVLEYGQNLMQQGASPARAFNEARKTVNKRYTHLDELKKIPDANQGILSKLFGEKKSNIEKLIKQNVTKAQKSKLVSDDEIAFGLLEKHYPPEFLGSLGLNLSDEFQSVLAGEGEQPGMQEQEVMQQSQPQQPQARQQIQQPQQQVQQSQLRQQSPQGAEPIEAGLAAQYNPGQYVGKKVRDNATGGVYRSDGAKWVRVE